jgi:hypothetical protein
MCNVAATRMHHGVHRSLRVQRSRLGSGFDIEPMVAPGDPATR